MVIDAFLACLFNVHYLIFLSMVHEYVYFLWIYLEIGLLSDGVQHIYEDSSIDDLSPLFEYMC